MDVAAELSSDQGEWGSLLGKFNQKRTAPGEPPPADEFPGLKESVDAILRELNQGYLKVPKAVTKTTATQTFGYAARQLITNFEVHVDQHAPGFLECWMRNHLIATDRS